MKKISSATPTGGRGELVPIQSLTATIIYVSPDFRSNWLWENSPSMLDKFAHACDRKAVLRLMEKVAFDPRPGHGFNQKDMVAGNRMLNIFNYINAREARKWVRRFFKYKKQLSLSESRFYDEIFRD